jgi:hypothetical protein
VHDPAAFHIFLSYSAHHVSSLAQGGKLKSRAILHKGKGIRLINNRLSASDGLQDKNLQAIVFMLAIENAFGSNRASIMYLNGLRKMVASRGGLQAIEDPWLLLQICWAEMTGTGRMSMDCVPCCDSGLISDSLSTYLANPTLGSDMVLGQDRTLSSLCDQFIFSLQDFQLLSFTRQASGRESFLFPSFEASQCHSVSATFRPRTPLKRLLFLPKSAQDRQGIVNIRDQCQLASLIYIHASLWEYRHSARDMDQFIVTLESQLVKDDLDEHIGSIEALLWTIVTNGNGNCLISPKRAQRVLQLVSMARRLNMESWNLVKDILMQGLVVRHWSEVGVLDPRWDAEKLRAEIVSCGGSPVSN